jgi:hypothetical protein
VRSSSYGSLFIPGWDDREATVEARPRRHHVEPMSAVLVGLSDLVDDE